MGTCLSKKSATAPSPSPLPPTTAQSAINSNPSKQETKPPDLQKKKPEEEGRAVKKEIFVIRHRKSHETERQSVDGNGDSKKDPDEVSEPVKGPAIKNGLGHLSVVSAPVRTSSCTKEEVDAILIQCGKLSRSPSRSVGSSDNNNGSLQKTKKYSGSKRSFDFDKEHEGPEENAEADGELERLHRQRQRQQRQPRHSLSPSTSSRNRRRTPSRERDPQEQRSGSRERNGGGAAGGGRRVSRSPGKRSESPNTVTSGNCRPGKMVSVPATVAMDKSIDGENILAASAVKRIQVRRNVGGGGGDGSRATAVASPRARSPATNQQQQQPSLSRSNSRKAEHSPFRRNPLGEIDTNVIIEPSGGTNNKPAKHNSSSQKINGDNISNMKVGLQGSNTNKLCSNNKTKEEEHHVIVEEHKVVGGNNAKVNLITPAGAEESLKTVTTRSRSSRLSRDLDINPEALLSNSSSSTQNYTALLLEDIQNFHQKNTPNAPSAFSLPACVTKACSILDAVADLNSSTSEDRRRNFKSDQFVNTNNIIGVKDQESSSIEPSIHKYVTLRRGNIVEDEEGDGEDQESSGSNSFAGASSGQQKPYWLSSSSSSWEPNSGDSTSRSYSRGDENHRSPLAGVQRHDTTIMDESSTRRLAAKKRDMEQSGVGNVRVGGGPHMSSMV